MIDKSTCEDHYNKVIAFADKIGKREQLEELLKRLDSMASFSADKTLHLYKDFAPYSFSFYASGINGGLIYHGAHDNGGDGSAPTFSVCLEECDGWSIHT